MKTARASKQHHLRGWIPDYPDQRDFLYADLRRAVAPPPPSVDLRAEMSPVEDQGQLGSCTANALAGALEFLEIKNGQPYVDLSRLFIYYDERVIEHTVATDSGAMIRDGVKTLAAQGVCSEKKWPYVISTFTKKPTPACYAEAKKHMIRTYHRILTLDEMRGCLADGFPFVFGFTVYESFEIRGRGKNRRSQYAEAARKDAGWTRGVRGWLRRQDQARARAQLLGNLVGNAGLFHHTLRLRRGSQPVRRFLDDPRIGRAFASIHSLPRNGLGLGNRARPVCAASTRSGAS